MAQNTIDDLRLLERLAGVVGDDIHTKIGKTQVVARSMKLVPRGIQLEFTASPREYIGHSRSIRLWTWEELQAGVSDQDFEEAVTDCGNQLLSNAKLMQSIQEEDLEEA